MMNAIWCFVSSVGMACAYFGLKLYMVLLAGRIICTKTSFDRLSGLIAGWLIILAFQNGLILALSACGYMYQSFFVIIIISIVLFTCRWDVVKSSLLMIKEKNFWICPEIIGICLVLTLIWLRSLFFYDFTWDAQTYGIPRLALWLNSGSIFNHMATLQLNLFANEWNAEINDLAFALFSSDYIGFGFGNLEILLWLFISIVWVSRLVGLSNKWALVLAAVLGSVPAMIGLACTIKGDLLAVVAFIISVGWLILAHKDKSSLSAMFCLISSTLAIGAKISAILPALAVFCFACGIFGGNWAHEVSKIKPLTRVGFFLILMIFSSRFWVNWFVYKNPIKRIDVEQAHSSLSNLFQNLQIVKHRFFYVLDEVQGKGAMWALSGSMGGAVWFLVITCILLMTCKILKYRRIYKLHDINKSKISEVVDNSYLMFVGGCILVGTVVSMTLSPAYPWTFRYFAPGIYLVLIFIGATLLRLSPRYLRIEIKALAVLSFLINIHIVSRGGEVIPFSNLKTLTKELKEANTSLKRICLLLKGPYLLANVELLGLDSGLPLKILAFKDLETSLIPFLGSNAQNHIQLVDNEENLLLNSAQPRWDVVAILQKCKLRDPLLKRKIEQQGYEVLVDNEEYVIALPSHRVELKALLDLSQIKWTPYNSMADVKMQISNGFPAVQSTIPVDSGFVSQPLCFKGGNLVKAEFEGEIESEENHAGHLSLHGKKSLILLSSGKYNPSETYKGIFSSEKAGGERISFGLGGWGKGSGNIRLRNLKLYEFRVKNQVCTNISSLKDK